MAGIGFRIEKILEGDTYLDIIKAHFYSAIIFSGPWILSILTLFCLGYFYPKNIDVQELLYFKTTIIYVFAFSLIGIGFLHLSLTRYLADKLYLKEEEALVPIFNSSILLTLIIQTSVGMILVSFLQVPFSYKFLTVMIFSTVSVMWIIMLFLTALRDFESIGWAFFVGSLATILFSLWWGKLWGVNGYFVGYFVGHLIIVTLLSARVFIEFTSKRLFDTEMFSFLGKHKMLIFIGFFYNLAIWIDKMVFWGTEKAIDIYGGLRSFPFYESATFFAYLTIIPALSLFLIKIETDFYKKFKAYYTTVMEKGSLDLIMQAKANMAASLRQNIGFVIVFQGVISLITIVFSAELAGLLRMQAVQIPIFRLSVMGAYLHSLLLILIIIILYFDFQELALGVTFLFFACNGILTYLSSFMELSYIGYGYLASGIIALMTGYYFLNHKLNRLEYLTFALQPIGVHRQEEIV